MALLITKNIFNAFANLFLPNVFSIFHWRFFAPFQNSTVVHFDSKFILELSQVQSKLMSSDYALCFIWSQKLKPLNSPLKENGASCFRISKPGLPMLPNRQFLTFSPNLVKNLFSNPGLDLIRKSKDESRKALKI